MFHAYRHERVCRQQQFASKPFSFQILNLPSLHAMPALPGKLTPEHAFNLRKINWHDAASVATSPMTEGKPRKPYWWCVPEPSPMGMGHTLFHFPGAPYFVNLFPTRRRIFQSKVRWSPSPQPPCVVPPLCSQIMCLFFGVGSVGCRGGDRRLHTRTPPSHDDIVGG